LHENGCSGLLIQFVGTVKFRINTDYSNRRFTYKPTYLYGNFGDLTQHCFYVYHSYVRYQHCSIPCVCCGYANALYAHFPPCLFSFRSVQWNSVVFIFYCTPDRIFTRHYRRSRAFLTTRREMVLELSVYSAFNHPTKLLAREHLIERTPSLHTVHKSSKIANLTFRGPCIVIYSSNESQEVTLFLRFI
jgi:hypothetical protein